MLKTRNTDQFYWEFIFGKGMCYCGILKKYSIYLFWVISMLID